MGHMEKLKEAKTIKELKEALVEIFEELDVEMENIAYTAVGEALKEKRNVSKEKAVGTFVRAGKRV